jgi:hypothetical protein
MRVNLPLIIENIMLTNKQGTLTALCSQIIKKKRKARREGGIKPDAVTKQFAIDKKSKGHDEFCKRMALTQYLYNSKGYTLAEIGRYFGRSHSTIVYYLRQHQIDIKHNRHYRAVFDRLEQLMIDN